MVLAGCGSGTVATVTVTDTAVSTVTVSAGSSAAVASSPAAGTTSAAPSSPRSSGATTTPTSSGGVATAASGVPTSAAQETILTVRIEAYDPASGTLTFVPQDLVETEGSPTAVLSDPASQAAPSTATVTSETNVKFAEQGRDISAAIAAGAVYANMVLEGNRVTYLWELYVT